MNRSIALSVIALSSIWMQSQTLAAEGRVSELSSTPPDPARVSSYAGASVGKDASISLKPGSTDASRQRAHTSGNKVQGKTARAAPVMSSKSSDFHIYDASSLLITDRDRDGYHSEFRIRFDADTTFFDARVYAKLYLRRVGEDDWWLYHVTDDFIVEGQSGDDDYFVTTALDDGFPTSDYDVLIDLYESGFSGIVATIGPYDSQGLSLLPLEEAGLDVPTEIGGYDIHEVSTTLLEDRDGDGHYSRFRITFDPDADLQGRLAYARVWVRGRGDEWIEEFVTEDFEVDSTGSADTYSFTAEWVSGYPTAYYDVQIDLYDAATNLLAASAGSERGELAQIPLEDQSRDRFVNPPSTGGGGGSTSSNERGGGGALTIWSVLALLLVGGIRKAVPRRRS